MRRESLCGHVSRRLTKWFPKVTYKGRLGIASECSLFLLNNGAEGTGYCSKMHKCNMGSPIVHRGEPDWHPPFQLLSPSLHDRGLTTAQQVDELVKFMTDTSNVTMWEPLTGGSGLRIFCTKTGRIQRNLQWCGKSNEVLC
jgi:hypothetical protein